MNINFPLDYLGDSADKHAAKIEALKAAHAKRKRPGVLRREAKPATAT